jgi:hypothetical protein
MSLCLLPQRTDRATRANGVRQPTFGMRLLQCVRLDDDGTIGLIIGRRTLARYGLAQYLVMRLDNGERRWVSTYHVSAVGTPRLEIVDGGLVEGGAA